ncbi:MAG: C40 family peptidase [Streptosporangiaceae bacterium]
MRVVRMLLTRLSRLPRPSRRTAPAWVAGLCVLGLVAGVIAAVTTSTAAVPRASAASPIASLPKVDPSKSSAPVFPGASMKADFADPAVQLAASSAATVEPLRTLRQADLLIVSPTSLSTSVLNGVLHHSGITSAERIEAVRMRINGTYMAVLGVDPSVFRSYAERPTASSNSLWDGVAAGGVAVSYTMGTMDHLKLGGTVSAAGKVTENLKVAAFGTMGIGGVDAVVSNSVATSLGMPAGNAIVVSASSTADLTSLATALGKLLPKGVAVEPLIRVVGVSAPASDSGYPTSAQLTTMLRAAYSRLGMPYVWGAAGPREFDCSGLVQWSFAQAGITMPRVAADQALTGPSVPISDLQPGDLLFYHTDPSAPDYISHVTIYLGNGWMIQAPRTGLDVEVVPADFGSEFAGAVRVELAVAAQVAASVA